MKKFLVFVVALVALVTRLYYIDIDALVEYMNVPKVIKLGNYNGKDLEWYVLDKNTFSYTLLLKSAVKSLEEYDYSETGWADSDIRRWLNEDFLNEAFTKELQAYIEYKRFEDNKAILYDKVYFLDNNYKINENLRRAKNLIAELGDEIYARPVIIVNNYPDGQNHSVEVQDKHKLITEYRLSETQYDKYSKIADSIMANYSSIYQRIDEAYNWVYDNYEDILKEKEPPIVLGFLLAKLGIANNLVNGRHYDMRYGYLPHSYIVLSLYYTGESYLDVECDIKNGKRKQKGTYGRCNNNFYNNHPMGWPSTMRLINDLNYNEKFVDEFTADYRADVCKFQGWENGLEKYYLNGNGIRYGMWYYIFVDGITGTIINHIDNYNSDEAEFEYKSMYEGKEYEISLKKADNSNNEYIFKSTPGYKNLLIYDALNDSWNPLSFLVYLDHKIDYTVNIKNIFDNNWYKDTTGEWYYVR